MSDNGGAGGLPDLSGDGRLAAALVTPGRRENRSPRVLNNCRTVTEILSLGGVYSEDEIKGLIRGAGKLAADAIKKGSARNYRAAMSVIFKAAEIGQKEFGLDVPDVVVNTTQAVQFYLPHNGRDAIAEEDIIDREAAAVLNLPSIESPPDLDDDDD